jgi:hypothetical protein
MRMSSLDTPPGEDKHVTTSVPFVSSSLKEVKAHYERRYAEACAPEMPIFQRAVRQLVRHGRPMFFQHSQVTHARHEILSTGLRAVGPAQFTCDSDSTIIVVPAIRLSIDAGWLSQEEVAQIPFKDIYKAQKHKADFDEVSRRTQAAISGVCFRGYLLATRFADISTSQPEHLWTGIVEETDAPRGWFQEFKHYVKHGGDLDWYPAANIKSALAGAPLKMWAKPMPEFAEYNVPSAEVPLMRTLNSMPYDDPAAYAEAAEKELRLFKHSITARELVLDMIKRSQEIDRAVVRMAGQVGKPIPSYEEFVYGDTVTS